MSSIPGYTLEEFLAWNYNVIIEEQAESNVSIAMAEALGAVPHRPFISQEKFAPVVALFEEHREAVEHRLDEFDEDEQSWRGYAGNAFDFIPDELYEEGSVLIKKFSGD